MRDFTYFGTLFEVHQKIMPDWKTDDVKFTVSELKDYGLVAATAASGTYYRIMLRPQAIALLESQFKDKVESVLDYAIKIKSLIPFV